VRSLGSESWDKPDAVQIKSIEETLKSLFPTNLPQRKSAKDPMLITLGEDDAASGSTQKSTGGIPGLDLVSTEGAVENEKLPENKPPPLMEQHKTLTTPETDKPFVDPKTKVDKPAMEARPTDKYDWHADNFEDVPVAEQMRTNNQQGYEPFSDDMGRGQGRGNLWMQQGPRLDADMRCPPNAERGKSNTHILLVAGAKY
jgi:hypothetical protein